MWKLTHRVSDWLFIHYTFSFIKKHPRSKFLLYKSVQGERKRERDRVVGGKKPVKSFMVWVVWKIHQAWWSHAATWDACAVGMTVTEKILKHICWTTFCPTTTNTDFFLNINLNSLCLNATRQSVFPQPCFTRQHPTPTTLRSSPHKNPSHFSHFFVIWN